MSRPCLLSSFGTILGDVAAMRASSVYDVLLESRNWIGDVMSAS